ncbi:MAG: zf-HC2 domain-containing protein [Phycisphaerales bacterium]
MDCTDLTALLSGFIDDELDAATRHNAERHLVECVRCRAMVARAEQLDARLRVAASSWGRESALPDAMIAGVLRRTVGDTRAVRRMRRVATVGWLAAAAALALAATAWFIDRSSAPRDRGLAALPAMSNDARSDPRNEPRSAAADGPAPTRGHDSAAPHTASGLGGAGGAATTASSAGSSTTGRAGDLLAARSVPSDAPSDDDPGAMLAPYLHGPPTVLASVGSSDEAVATSDPATGPDDGAAVEENGATASGMEAEFDAPGTVDEMRQEDADALAAAAVLLRQLAEADTSTFAEAERVRDIVEYDGLVDRLVDAHDRLRGDDRAACWSAESFLLRLERGPLGQDDLRRMKHDLRKLDLPARLERASQRLDERNPA